MADQVKKILVVNITTPYEEMVISGRNKLSNYQALGNKYFHRPRSNVLGIREFMTSTIQRDKIF